MREKDGMPGKMCDKVRLNGVRDCTCDTMGK